MVFTHMGAAIAHCLKNSCKPEILADKHVAYLLTVSEYVLLPDLRRTQEMLFKDQTWYFYPEVWVSGRGQGRTDGQGGWVGGGSGVGGAKPLPKKMHRLEHMHIDRCCACSCYVVLVAIMFC